MDHSRLAVCGKHLDRELGKLMGSKKERELVIRKGNDKLMFCFCGKPSEWYIRDEASGRKSASEKNEPKEGLHLVREASRIAEEKRAGSRRS